MQTIHDRDSDLQKQIKAKINERFWSVKTLSKASGIPVTTLRGNINGTTKPNIDTLFAIAKALGTTMDQLMSPYNDGQIPCDLRKQIRDESENLGRCQLISVLNYMLFLEKGGVDHKHCINRNK